MPSSRKRVGSKGITRATATRSRKTAAHSTWVCHDNGGTPPPVLGAGCALAPCTLCTGGDGAGDDGAFPFDKFLENADTSSCEGLCGLLLAARGSAVNKAARNTQEPASRRSHTTECGTNQQPWTPTHLSPATTPHYTTFAPHLPMLTRTWLSLQHQLTWQVPPLRTCAHAQ